MIVHWNDPLAQLIVPSLDGNEGLPIFYAVLPDEPGTPGKGCVSYYVLDERGHVEMDAKTDRPVTKTVEGMTSWRVKPEYENLIPHIKEIYARQHG